VSALVQQLGYPRDFSKQLRERLARGLSLDAGLQELRSAGASIMECIAATKRVRGCNLAEAKRLVHFSPAWADVAKRAEAVWADLEEELNKNAEAGASPDGDPASRSDNPGVTDGSPSVS
jgi:hypothetical protein